MSQKQKKIKKNIPEKLSLGKGVEKYESLLEEGETTENQGKASPLDARGCEKLPQRFVVQTEQSPPGSM